MINLESILENNGMIVTSDGTKAVTIRYNEDVKGIWQITSVETLTDFRGKGLASEAMDIFFKKAKESNKKIYPICSFAQHWVKKHDEHKEHFASPSELI